MQTQLELQRGTKCGMVVKMHDNGNGAEGTHKDVQVEGMCSRATGKVINAKVRKTVD